MSQFEIYLLLFTDVLTANLAFNTSSEIVLDTMNLFGNYHKQLMLSVALIAYVFSIGINYILGVACYKILSPAKEEQIQLNTKINNIKNSKLLAVIIAIDFLPFFTIFSNTTSSSTTTESITPNARQARSDDVTLPHEDGSPPWVPVPTEDRNAA